VTTREKLHRLVDALPEVEVEAELERLTSRLAANTDEWGDLSKLHETAFGETMRRLAEEERAAGHKPW
jgi:hypothetical protein